MPPPSRLQDGPALSLGLQSLESGVLGAVAIGMSSSNEFSSSKRSLVQAVQHVDRHLPVDTGVRDRNTVLEGVSSLVARLLSALQVALEPAD